MCIMDLVIIRPDVMDLFKAMLPDSKIAEKMQLRPNKLKHVVYHAIDPFFKELLKSQVVGTDWFVVSFDDSLKDVAEKCEMDIYIQYWKKENNQVEEWH